MFTTYKMRADWFRTDQAGIDELKNRCYNEAREFSFFRKGRWTGFEASLDNAARQEIRRPLTASSPVASYSPSKNCIERVSAITGASAGSVASIVWRYYDPGRPSDDICRRVICAQGLGRSRVTRWEYRCGAGSVVTIPKSQVGPFTYIVSDRMWAIFTRFAPDELRGITGKDRRTILTLRESFDLEFIAANVRRALSLKSRRDARKRLHLHGPRR